VTFTPTDEQVAIVEAAKRTKDNLLVSALAGAAKTSTLELITKAVVGIPILSLAFNKKIAEEMKRRLPSHVTCQTMNALGHRAWGSQTGKRLVLETSKMADIVKSIIEDFPREDKGIAYDLMGDTLKMIAMAKTNGYIPPNKFANIQPLIEEEDFLAGLDEEPHPLQIDILRAALSRSISAAYDGLVDFNDQLYMPTIFGGIFPKPPLVLVDEAQDLSPLNHHMLHKIVTKRIIAVGDPYQSIYGFRGAVANGMSQLKSTFSMRELGLTISFRCPKAVVEIARLRAPHMQWAPQAAEGEVLYLDEHKLVDIPDFAAIICRNNAPLFKLAFRLIREGRGVTLVGADIGPSLIRILKKLGPEDTPQETVFELIAKWEAEAHKKTRAKASLADRAECLRIFAAQGPTLAAAIAYAEHLFKAQGPIQLLSGHKSKGLEWDTVYHLDSHLIPAIYAKTQEALQQEENIRYVINTRAKQSLRFVNSDSLT